MIYVFHSGKRVPKPVRDAIGGAQQWAHVQDPWQWPNQCQFYVQSAGLTMKAERAAASMGALVVVLPEQEGWLQNAIKVAATEGDVYIFAPAHVGEMPLYHTAPGATT